MLESLVPGWTDPLLELARGIDPERANVLERELESGEARAVAILLSTAFPPLRPTTPWQRAAVERIAGEGWRVERQRDDVTRRLLAAAGDFRDPDHVATALRRSTWEEKARIALRELLPAGLGGAPIEVTARELSGLADATFEVAIAEAAARVAERFGVPRRTDGLSSELVVLGLGKLGGLELNAGSDVDVMFMYDTDDGKSELLLHDHWTRVARRTVQTLEAPTPDGMVWRVDLRLRPEGSQGPIVNSVAAAERYYETWGRSWERAALLRARPIAGNRALGSLIERELFTPFVYRHEVDPELATVLAELVGRARAELSSDPARDVKLGPGGIREAEFFVQSLQLIWGGREPSLRVPGTLAGLFRLRSRGLVSDREAREIAQAYVLLRRVEHRIQWMTGIQTHLLPESPSELERLARTLGFQNAEVLQAELGNARTRVAELFGSLAPTAPRPLPRHQLLLTKLDAARDAPDLAFDPVQSDVIEHLAALARRPDELLGALTRDRYPELGDQVLDAIFDCADPEQAARYLRSFFARFVTPGPYVAALAEDVRALRRLITALGASAFVADAVVGRPDLADVIVFGGEQLPVPRAVVEAELETFERSTLTGKDSYELREAFVSALRRARSRTMVEVAVADLAGAVRTREATFMLSELADAIIDRAVAFELARARADGGKLFGDARGLAVLAVGKLGGRDIGYGSDLDVLFVYDLDAAPAGSDPGEYFGRRAQQVISLISEPHPSGPGYELDTRLRPSGSHGLLVTSLGSFARYHGVAIDAAKLDARPLVLSSGAAWERQALLRARFCAGDRELGERAIAIAHVAAYERGAPPVEEMQRLRLRMQHELARERPGRYDLKFGQGGLLDIEFAAQWLQMRHGSDLRLRTTDTAEALERLQSTGQLGRPEYETFRDGYLFLRRLEQRIHVFSGKSSTVIDVDAPGLVRLARRMNLGGAGAPEAAVLIERYRQVTSAVRGAYERVLGV